MKEPELIAKCQHGDPTAQEKLFLLYSNRMFRLSLRYVKTREDAEDIMITSFSSVFRHIKNFRYEEAGGLEGWIRRIVVNESLMWLRRRYNFNLTESLDELQPEPDLSQLAALEAHDILAMVEKLPMGYRVVFNLSVVEGYSHEEISSLLGINTGTSRSQLFKAKSLLKKMLTQEGYQYGT